MYGQKNPSTLLLVLFFLGITTLLLPGTVICSAATSFFSEEETLLLRMSEQEWHDAIQSEIHRKAAYDVLPYTGKKERRVISHSIGPVVSIVDPRAKGSYYESEIPIQLLVFLRRYKAPIDIDTLHITGKRGIFSLDVTDRLIPFLRKPVGSENADFVIDGEIEGLSPGHYQVVMSVADIDGNVRQHSIFLEVQDGGPDSSRS